MSMAPQAQQNWEVDLGYCTSMSGIKGHGHVTFLIYIRSIDLQKQYSNILKKHHIKHQIKQQTKIFHFVRGINFYKTKKPYVKSRCPNMDLRQVEAWFFIHPVPFCITQSTIFEQLHIHGTSSTAKLRGWPGILHINERHQRSWACHLLDLHKINWFAKTILKHFEKTSYKTPNKTTNKNISFC